MTNLAAIIVAFNPEADFVNLVDECSHQFSEVLIIFNSENRTSLSTTGNVTVIENDSNAGLSKALNQGVMSCQQKKNIEWCIFFDQDTQLMPGFVTHLSDCILKVGDKEKPSIIGQNYINRSGTKRAYKIDMLTRIDAPIVTSGSAIPVSMFERIGIFDENLFIEGIDTEFCLRAVSHGLGIYVSSDVLMVHGAGDDKSAKCFGRIVNVSGHKPERFYLQWKHHVYAYKKTYKDLGFVFLKVFPSLIRNLLVIILFEKRKISIVMACFRGLRDGFRM
jgi:rhamnosyltransferase